MIGYTFGVRVQRGQRVQKVQKVQRVVVAASPQNLKRVRFSSLVHPDLDLDPDLDFNPNPDPDLARGVPPIYIFSFL